MEWGRLKNIIILILLLVNGFLLVLVGARRREALSYDQAALERTLSVLEERGIQTQADTLVPAGNLRPMTVERDLAWELQMAQALLGQDVEAENRGGGLYLYRSNSGEVSIRSGGELSAQTNSSIFWQTDFPELYASRLLEKMGIEAEQTGMTQEDEWTRVRFRQLWNGVPLFSCEVEFVYYYNFLHSIQGTLLPVGQGVEETGTVLTLPTALMRFLDGITAAGDVCSSIQSMEAGYRIASQPLSGGARLTAVWLVSSNTADYYLDGATGALTRLTDQ